MNKLNVEVETYNEDLIESNLFSKISTIDYYVDSCEQPELDIKEYYLKPDRPFILETVYQYKIFVKLKHVPFYIKPRRLSFSEKNSVNKIIDDLLQEGKNREKFIRI